MTQEIIEPEKPRLLRDRVDISRRWAALGAIGAVSYLAGMKTAQAATPTFEDVLYKSKGTLASQGSKARTSANRWGDYINVKDYGATGDGVTDDSVAIQAAFSARGTPPAGGGINHPAARVYFPTGTYIVSLQGTSSRGIPYAIILDDYVSGNVATCVFGDGANTTILGNFTGYLFVNDGAAAGGPMGFRDLGLFNNSTANGSGCLSLLSANTAFIENCAFGGFQCVDFCNNLSSGSEQPHVSGCSFGSSASVASGGSPGSWGISCTNATTIIACGFTGFGGIGSILTTNVGVAVIGCRFEVNNIGINVGILGNAGNNGTTGFLLAGLSMEDNGTFIKVSAAGNGAIIGVSMQGENASVASAFGLDLRGSSGQILVQGLTCNGYFTGNGIILNDNDPTTTFIGVAVNVNAGGGTNWSGGNGSTFIGTTRPLTAKTYANRPTNPVLGTTFYCSDASTATIGQSFTGSGANQVKGEWDGTVFRVAQLYT